MILVVDANIFFSALIKAGFTRNILLLSGYDFYAPEYFVHEFKKHLLELKKKTGLAEEEIGSILDELLEASETTLVPFEEFKDQRSLAESLSPDLDDVTYIALALHLGCPVWSNDAALKKQDTVKVIKTKDLYEHLRNKKELEKLL